MGQYFGADDRKVSDFCDKSSLSSEKEAQWRKTQHNLPENEDSIEEQGTEKEQERPSPDDI